MAELPKAVKAASLVDVTKLNLSGDAANRVSMKISEAVLAEYATTTKPSSLVIAGRISDILKVPDIEWVGMIAPDIDLIKEKGLAGLDESITQILKS